MKAKESKARTGQPIRWAAADWVYLAEIAKAIGTTRSDFIRTATLNAAKAVEAVSPSYSVGGATATPQNTRINLFPGEAGTKLDTGGGQDAPDRSRSDGEAKGGPTSGLQDHRPRRAVSRKA